MNFHPDEFSNFFLNNANIEDLVTQTKQEALESATRVLINKFLALPVTREILAGPNGTNISGTLGGRGNLFTFIGFPADSDPIGQVVSILENGMKLIKYRKRAVSGGGARFDYNLLTPESQIRSSTPLPFENGNSWVYGIEEGIDGFSHYIYTRLETKASRSQRGIQNVNANMAGDFTPTPYITPLLEELRETVNNAI